MHLKLGLPRLYLQHAYGSVGQTLQGWDPSDKVSTVTGSVQNKSDETKDREAGVGPVRKKGETWKVCGMSQLSHFRDASA